MIKKTVEIFRKNLRRFERELGLADQPKCCGGIPLAECHVLIELDILGRSNLKNLVAAMYLDKSNLSRTIESMVKKNLVGRSIPNNNRRSVVLELTPQGRKLCSMINKENNSYFIKALRTIPKENLRIFLDSFEILAKAMAQLNTPTSKAQVNFLLPGGSYSNQVNRIIERQSRTSKGTKKQ